MISSVYNTLSLGSLMFPNHKMQNMPNLYNLLISILLINENTTNIKNEIIQMIKINLGLSFYDDFRQYIIKKFPIDHELIKIVK